MSLSQIMLCIGAGVAFGGSLYAGYVNSPELPIRYLVPTVIWSVFWFLVALNEDE